MQNDQPDSPQGSIVDDLREIKESRRLSWTNTPDGPLSKERDLDKWTLPLYDLHLDKQSPANPFKHIDEDKAFQTDLKWYDSQVDKLRGN